MRTHGHIRTTHPRRAAIGSLLLIAVAVWSSPVFADDSNVFTLTGLTGSQTKGEVVAIESGGKLKLKGRTEPILLSGLRGLRRAEASYPSKEPGKIRVHLEAGGYSFATGLTVKNEKVTFARTGGKSITVPMEAVRAVQFEAKPSPLFLRALQTTSTDYDRFLILVEGKPRTVRGLLESLGEKSAAIVVNDRNIKVVRSDLLGIVFASAKAKKITGGMSRLHLADGSRVVGTIESLSKTGALKLKLPQGASVELAWSEVNNIDVFSDRLQYVSDLKPVNAIERAIVTLKRSWKKDKSVTGGMLTVGGRKFEKGLGVHAESRLTYTIDGKYETFAAIIGLDDPAGKRGDCIFIVQADGREVFRKRMTGKDAPANCTVKVSGVQRLTLVVEPGRNLDIADHANWCAASLIRAAK